VEEESQGSRRRAWHEGREAGVAGGWLSLDDDELLYRIEATEPGPTTDGPLLEIVQSDRHFFIRQEAAKKIADVSLLKEHAGDRHIGQILVRAMRRREDVAYLERLVAETRHLEVRKAAEAQLRQIAAVRGRERV
jgi:hypothetical protein